jgi:uncharacterized protein (DUF4415 family)
MRGTKSAQSNEVRALKRMKDREIDTTDIPPVLDWSKAVVGKFYRPIKKPLTIRLDADVLAWLKGQGRGYQTRINALLRGSMEQARSEKATVRVSGHPRGQLTKIRRREPASQGRSTGRRGG